MIDRRTVETFSEPTEWLTVNHAAKLTGESARSGDGVLGVLFHGMPGGRKDGLGPWYTPSSLSTILRVKPSSRRPLRGDDAWELLGTTSDGFATSMANPIQTPVVSFVNLKGGVGKTALSVNLAFALAEWHSKSVLLVDIDPQFNATQHLLDEQVIVKELSGRTIKDILDPPPPTINVGTAKVKRKTRRNASDFIREVQTEGDGSLGLLPSLLDLSFVNRNPLGKEGRLEQFLQKVEQDCDIILIDCPPTISILTVAAFNASRYYVVPVTPDYFAPIGIPLIEEEVSYFLENLHAESGEMHALGIVFTMVDSRWHADWESVARRVQRATEIEPFTTFFTYSKHWRDCAASHEPVYRDRPYVKPTAQIRSFSLEFMRRLEEAEAGRDT